MVIDRIWMVIYWDLYGFNGISEWLHGDFIWFHDVWCDLIGFAQGLVMWGSYVYYGVFHDEIILPFGKDGLNSSGRGDAWDPTNLLEGLVLRPQSHKGFEPEKYTSDPHSLW